MVHEIAVNCVNVAEPVRFGLPNFDHGMNQGSWFRKRTSSCTSLHQQDCGFPQGRYLHFSSWLWLSAQDVFPQGWY